MNKPSIYILLPTEKAIIGCILDNGKGHLLGICTEPNYTSKTIKPFHLYILSSDEIKEGDWHYDSSDGKIKQWKGNLHSNRLTSKKIIATTNPELLDTLIESSYFDSFRSKSDIAPIDSVIKGEDGRTDLEYIISLHNGKGKEVDIEKLATDFAINDGMCEDFETGRRSFIGGYNKHLQDNADKKFTENQMKEFALGVRNNDIQTVAECFEDFKKHYNIEQPNSNTVMVEYEEFPLSGYFGNDGIRFIYKPKLEDGNICIVR